MGSKILKSSFWDKYFKTYDILNKIYPYQKLINNVIDKLIEIRSKKILDAGAGTGNLSLKLLDLKGDIYSLDNSKEGLNIYLKKNKNAKIFFHDLKDPLPFSNKTFDIIVSINTICYVDREFRQKIINEFYRVLKNNGKIIIINLLKNFKSYRIFLDHINEDITRNGIIKSIYNIIKLLPKIIKMFYFTSIIQKYNKNNQFFDNYEQFNYLKEAGFKNVCNNEYVFSNQAVLNEAIK